MGEGGSTPFPQGLLWAVNTDPPPCSKGPGATPASLGGGAQQLPVAEAGPAHTLAPPGQTVSQSLWSQSSGHVWGPGPCSPPSAPSPAPTALGPRSVPPHSLPWIPTQRPPTLCIFSIPWKTCWCHVPSPRGHGLAGRGPASTSTSTRQAERRPQVPGGRWRGAVSLGGAGPSMSAKPPQPRWALRSGSRPTNHEAASSSGVRRPEPAPPRSRGVRAEPLPAPRCPCSFGGLIGDDLTHRCWISSREMPARPPLFFSAPARR